MKTLTMTLAAAMAMAMCAGKPAHGQTSDMVRTAVTITPQQYNKQRKPIQYRKHRKKFKIDKNAPTRSAAYKRAPRIVIVSPPMPAKPLDLAEFGEISAPVDLLEMLPRDILGGIIAAQAKEYLVKVTTAGGTMLIYGRRIMRQQLADQGVTGEAADKYIKSHPKEVRRVGVEFAVGMLHDVFAIRLARAIKQARHEGYTIGVFSAFRGPDLGIGGFRDKNMSTHAAGIATDVTGIDSATIAIAWQRIANANGLYLPYGPHNRAERNHTQLLMIATTRERPKLYAMIKTKKSNVDRLALWKASGVSPDMFEPVSVQQLAYYGGNFRKTRKYARHIKRHRQHYTRVAIIDKRRATTVR